MFGWGKRPGGGLGGINMPLFGGGGGGIQGRFWPAAHAR